MVGNTGAAAGSSSIGVESSMKGTFQLFGVQATSEAPGTKQTSQQWERKASGDADEPKSPKKDLASNPFFAKRPGSGAAGAKSEDKG